METEKKYVRQTMNLGKEGGNYTQTWLNLRPALSKVARLTPMQILLLAHIVDTNNYANLFNDIIKPLETTNQEIADVFGLKRPSVSRAITKLKGDNGETENGWWLKISNPYKKDLIGFERKDNSKAQYMPNYPRLNQLVIEYEKNKGDNKQTDRKKSDDEDDRSDDEDDRKVRNAKLYDYQTEEWQWIIKTLKR